VSTSRLDVLLTEAGLDPFDQQALTVLEEMLALVPDEAPAPSAELQAALSGRRPAVFRAGSAVSLPACAAAALLSVSTVVGLGGLAAAANQLPDGMQRAVSEWSQRHLPFTFPRPAHHAGVPEPGQSTSPGPGSLSLVPAGLPPGLAPVPSAGVLRPALLPPLAGPSVASSPWLVGASASASPSGYASVTPSASPTVLPSGTPSELPSELPSALPSELPPDSPSELPSAGPSESPSGLPSDSPSDLPSAGPSESPTDSPSPTGTASSDPSPTDGATLSDIPSPTPEGPATSTAPPTD
jgi:hypothetical protein